MGEPQFRLSHADFLALIGHQANVVAGVTAGISRGTGAGPSDLMQATQRLNELVSTWLSHIPAPAEEKAA